MRNLGKKRNSKVKEIFIAHIKNNIREYSIIVLLFLIGIICGVIFVNNASQSQIEDITSYLNDFTNSLKAKTEIDKGVLIKDCLISNFLLVLALWFVGSTVIGIPIVYGIIIYRGFCLGYTISSVVATLGIGKRNSIYYNFNFAAKYYFYPMYISIGC